jgi:hypothetical protein
MSTDNQIPWFSNGPYRRPRQTAHEAGALHWQLLDHPLDGLKNMLV